MDISNISDILNSQLTDKITTMKIKMYSSAEDELGSVAEKIAETGDPDYILELSPMAIALCHQSQVSNKQ